MKARKWMWMGLMSLGALPISAQAQVPGVPAAPAFGAAAAPAAVAGAPAAQPSTLWSFLGVSKPQLETCRQKKCATPCGQFINKMTMPLSAFTGGIIPPYCPLTPSLAELADQGAVGAAAKIKAEEAQAKARKAAMRYLGTVDCTRFPDAQDALVKGLRGDTNECVRYEAALALGNGCCCTKATMEALSVSASCSDRDGAPREYSDRVRAAAVSALQRCLSCFVDPNPPKQEKPVEGKPEEGKKDDKKPEEIKAPGDKKDADKKDADKKDAGIQKAAPDDEDYKESIKDNAKDKAPRPVGADYYAKIGSVPRSQIVEEARRVVEKYNQNASAQYVLNRETSVVGIINQTMADSASPSQTAMNNGSPVARAEVVSARPQNLWEVVSRNAEPAHGHAIVNRTDAVARSTAEPPTAYVKSTPVTPNLDTMTSLPEPITTKSEPTIVKSPKSKEIGGYGELGTVRPKTPAELAGQTRVGNSALTPVKPTAPNPLPMEVTAKEANKLTERESMKPIEIPTPVAKPVEKSMPKPTPLAQRALTIMIDQHPAAVREQITGSLTKADFDSCPDITPVLVEVARSTEADTTRRAAIQALVRNQINDAGVIAALEKLADDAPPSVRVEAAIGLARLKVGK